MDNQISIGVFPFISMYLINGKEIDRIHVVNTDDNYGLNIKFSCHLTGTLQQQQKNFHTNKMSSSIILASL